MLSVPILPDDSLAHTLQYLKLQDITRLLTMNKHYHEVVEHYLISLAKKLIMRFYLL